MNNGKPRFTGQSLCEFVVAGLMYGADVTFAVSGKAEFKLQGVGKRENFLDRDSFSLARNTVSMASLLVIVGCKYWPFYFSGKVVVAFVTDDTRGQEVFFVP